MAGESENRSPIDAVILAGGAASEEMALLTGTPIRALFPFRGKPFVQWVFEALRAVPQVERIAVVGPVEHLERVPHLAGNARLVPERDTMEANLFGAIAELLPHGRVLVAACDNPLLSSDAFQDFLERCPNEAGVCYPVMEHRAFLAHFPGATNVAVRLKDGAYIGGDCVLLQSGAIPKLEYAIRQVAAARKSLFRMVSLLGWGFVVRFALKRVTSSEVEERASQVAGVPVRFVRDCNPVFALDIDDPEDWRYLVRWDALNASST